jgi:hypothetical protein
MSTLNRRQFITGLSLSLTNVPVAALAFTRSDTVLQRETAVFRQWRYRDGSGHGERYTPAVGNASTRRYRASLDESEFLRRHWFH